MKTPLLITAVLAAVCVGCGEGPEATFVLQDDTKDLLREARSGYTNENDEEIPGVEGYLDELFGTPNDLVAWTRLPVDFGGAAGTVVATDEGDVIREFQVTFEGEAPALEPGEPFTLTWTGGENAYNSWQCIGLDAETGTIRVDKQSAPEAEGNLPSPPAVGAGFVVNAGQKLKHGRQLYMTHCLHCHGVSGDGNGPTAKYLNPLPRDYRKGIFKFTSTKGGAVLVKPHRDDLARVIKYGIPGTYMPSFLLLKDDELSAIVEYVRWLAMRGELENSMVQKTELPNYSRATLEQESTDSETGKVDRAKLSELTEQRTADLKKYLAGDGEIGNFSEDLNMWVDILVEDWLAGDSPDNQLLPEVARTEMTAESVQRGRQLFLGQANCANCHGIAGRGDGPQTKEITPESKELGRGPGLFDSWGNPIQPRNLTTGIYRGGRRPLDLYRRIRAGIKGAVMPAAPAGLSDEQIWDIVNYVLSVPLDSDDVVKGDAGEESAGDQEEVAGDGPAVETAAN